MFIQESQHNQLKIYYHSNVRLHKNITVSKNTKSKAIRKEEIKIKTLKCNDLSNQLTLEICDSAFFPVADSQISIHSQIKILTSSKPQQYDFNFILELFEFLMGVSVHFKSPNQTGK